MGHCSRSQKRNVLFILIASPLLYVPPLFFRLDRPQRLQGCFALLQVTICCRWDSHVILLLTVVRSGAFAAQDVGVQQLLPVRWWADVSVGLIISWETDLLASYILQVAVSYRPQNEEKKVVSQEKMYLNSCYSCFSAEYWLLLWDNRRVVAYRKHTLWAQKAPRRFVWRLVLWFDEIPEIGKCSRKIKSDKSFYSWLFQERYITRESAYTQICMFKREVPLGCRWRSATSPKSPNGRGLAFMWIMLFILGLSSYISVLQTSTPSQPFGISKYFTGFLCRIYYQGPCSGKCVCVRVQESLKGFIKEWKVCSHLCRLATALTCTIQYMPSYGQSQILLSKTNTAPYRPETASATQSWRKSNEHESRIRWKHCIFFCFFPKGWNLPKMTANNNRHFLIRPLVLSYI